MVEIGDLRAEEEGWGFRVVVVVVAKEVGGLLLLREGGLNNEWRVVDECERI